MRDFPLSSAFTCEKDLRESSGDCQDLSGSNLNGGSSIWGYYDFFNTQYKLLLWLFSNLCFNFSLADIHQLVFSNHRLICLFSLVMVTFLMGTSRNTENKA